MQTVSTQVVKLDLQTILANYKNPNFWAKKWTIIDTKEIKLVWYITSINCVDNKIESRVEVAHKNIRRGKKHFRDLTWYGFEYEIVSPIPINNPEYTEKHFENAILGRVLSLLESIERHCTYEYAEYKEAETLEEEVKERLKTYAEDYLDENNVSNEDIREAYIEKYVSNNSNEGELTDKIIKRFRHKIIPDTYLYVYAWFNRSEEFDKFEFENTKHRVSTRIEIWRKVQEIQTDEWTTGMKNQLELI